MKGFINNYMDQQREYISQLVTHDYILELYKQANSITNKKAKTRYIKDLKQLIPHINQEILIPISENENENIGRLDPD